MLARLLFCAFRHARVLPRSRVPRGSRGGPTFLSVPGRRPTKL
ncbi:Hypothetical protein AA314_00096 [Archangium gephyra]|uniref:Uncharacterized protein n=1 Tax=Archangium gephyra TaxID=48 RepID=A0AAC8TA07_9BACT|nr:Hypothetical protein AA314_00096 [Archangium gephyra]